MQKLPPEPAGACFFRYSSVLHTMHGHCKHTYKISGAADSQNTQHLNFSILNPTLHFAAVFVSLQSLLYAILSEFQPFCTVLIFCIYLFCTISSFGDELQEVIHAIHPALSHLHCTRSILAGLAAFASKRVLFLQDSRRAPPAAASALQTVLHFFAPLRHFLKACHAKTGENA